MGSWGAERLLCCCACVAAVALVEGGRIWVKEKQHDGHNKFCTKVNIGSSLFNRMFASDIDGSEQVDKAKPYPQSNCYYIIDAKQTLIITGDKNKIEQHGRDKEAITDCGIVPVQQNGIANTSVLTIENTNITAIRNGDFQSWSTLEILKINSNSQLTTIEGGAFKGLNNVWKLEIMDNGRLSYLQDDSLSGLTNLRGLFLISNNISSVLSISSALNISYVPNLVHLDLSGNNILTIGEFDFTPMQDISLYSLEISMTKTVYIHPRALDPFSDNIRALGFSEVNVNHSVLLDFINRTTVANKNLAYVTLQQNLFCGSPHKLMEAMSNSTVGLDIGSNHFGLMKPGFFPVMHKLKYLDLTNIMEDEIPNSVINSTVFPLLEHLYLGSNMFTKLVPSMITPTLSRLVVASPIPSDGSDPTMSDFEINKSVLQMMPLLELLDLSGNKLNTLTPNMFQHAPKLKVLLLTCTWLTEIQDGSFANNTELYYLDLSKNMFPIVSSFTGEIFYGLSNLLALDLSYTYIEKITEDIFYHIPKLQYLSLRGNPIANLNPFLFVPVPYLKFLDLRFNIIVSWDQEIFPSHHCVEEVMLNYNNIVKITRAMLTDFKRVKQLNLFANSITCDCDLKNIIHEKINLGNLPFLKTTDCAYPHGLNSTLYMYLQGPLYECISYTNAITACSIMLLLIIVLVLTVLYFKFKYDVQYRLLLLKKKLGITNIYRSKKNVTNRGYFQYDAFVSYSALDSSFVEKMLMILEKDGSKYKLCVFERDFQPGDNLVDRVLECMEVSMVTILILTEAFAKSEWCRWEMSIAQNKVISQHFLKDSLILVIKSRISESLMTPTLKYLMETRVYLEWHEHSSVRQNIFWEKLKDTLKERTQARRLSRPHPTYLTIDTTDKTIDETVT